MYEEPSKFNFDPWNNLRTQQTQLVHDFTRLSVGNGGEKLRQSQDYQIVVQASNKAGDGPRSVIKIVKTAAPSQPDRPIIYTAHSKLVKEKSRDVVCRLKMSMGEKLNLDGCPQTMMVVQKLRDTK